MKKGMYITAIVLGIVLLGSTGYVYTQYKNVKKGVEEMQIEIDEDREKEVEEDEPLLFLLLGIGDRPDDPGRADSVICVSVHPKTKSVLMFNIPRDTITEIVGSGREDKVNHAYAYGGREMVKDTVENFIDHSFDYVVQINMDGLRQLVDTFGGIEVNNKFAFDQKDELGKKSYHYDEGSIHLDGEEALHYSRMRKSDPKGDLGRNERQQQVIQALVKKATSASSLFKIREVSDVLGNNIQTDISFDKMKQFYAQFGKEWESYEITTLEIQGDDLTVDGVYYYQVSDEERNRIRNSLEEFLQFGVIND